MAKFRSDKHLYPHLINFRKRMKTVSHNQHKRLREPTLEKGVWDSEETMSVVHLKCDIKALRTPHAPLFPYFCHL